MLVLASHVSKTGRITVYMEGGAVKFDADVSVTPARAKQILEDALEALNKWTLEQ